MPSSIAVLPRSNIGVASLFSGQSSSLIWSALARLRKRPPRSVLIENVPFMLQLSNGEAIRQIRRELESLGYRWAYHIVDARAFGLPKRCPRVFIFATREGDPRQVLLAEDAPVECAKGDVGNGNSALISIGRKAIADSAPRSIGCRRSKAARGSAFQARRFCFPIGER